LFFFVKFASAAPEEEGQSTSVDSGAISLEATTKSGPVIGQLRSGVVAFKGIPFAAPPVGELRFAPPQDPQPWTEPLKTANPGSVAWQIPVPAPAIELPKYDNMSEDCLNLNVFVPAGTKPGDGLPVYFFIHGGGFSIGSGNQFLYDGTELSRMGLVVVTANYRLGGLGFLATSETLRRYGTTGNWGLLDQIKALEWVRDNIEAFGGAPDKVTVGGESAGAMSVSTLVLSPLAKGLFRGAIMESGSILSLSHVPNDFTSGEVEKAVEHGRALLSVFGVGDDAEGLSELRKIAPWPLTRLTPFSFDWTQCVPFTFLPVRDGRVVPSEPLKALAEGAFNRVPILIGYNSDEGALFVPRGAGDESLRDALVLSMGFEAASAFWRRFPPDDQNTVLERARQAFGYSVFAAAAKRLADLHSRFGPVYFYNFDYVSRANRQIARGAIHTAELGLIFDTIYDRDNPAEAKLGQEMRARWVNFIKSGDPNRGDPLPSEENWPSYDPANPMVLKIDEVLSVVPLEREPLDFMADLLYGPVSGGQKP
jgi:para-nitrobenzyl esterase